MSDNTGQPLNAPDVGDAINKGKEYAKEHPDQARSAIDKVEDMIDQATGGKFKDLVDKGGDFVEGQLGLPDSAPQPAPGEEPAPPAPTDPTQPAPDPNAPPAPDPGQPPPDPSLPAPVPGEPAPSDPAPADPTGGAQPAPDEQPAPGGDADPTGGTGSTGPAQDGGVLGSETEWQPGQEGQSGPPAG